MVDTRTLRRDGDSVHRLRAFVNASAVRPAGRRALGGIHHHGFSPGTGGYLHRSGHGAGREEVERRVVALQQGGVGLLLPQKRGHGRRLVGLVLGGWRGAGGSGGSGGSAGVSAERLQ
jgi:hypothetical protein